MLGNPAPDVVSSLPLATGEDSTTNEARARSELNLLENEPTTNIQVEISTPIII